MPTYKLRSYKKKVYNLSFILGRISVAHGTSYCMSKYAVEASSDALRQEMKAWKLSVHIIEPDYFKTDLISATEKSWKQHWIKQSNEMKNEYGKDYYDNGKTVIQQHKFC